MPTELDLATLAAEVERLASTEAHRWKVEQVEGQLRVYVTLAPLGSADIYCLRLAFGEALASGPPSVTFCDPESHAEGRLQDWPKGLTGYFKHPPGNGVGWICNPWTREGRAHHAEWRSHPWGPKRAVWRVATAIQDILDHPGAYIGRAQ
jgi:hypothetical protein